MSTQQEPQEVTLIASRKSCSADGVGLSHYILMDKKPKEASIIASRKSCSADGVGLSHYIMMDKEKMA